MVFCRSYGLRPYLYIWWGFVLPHHICLFDRYMHNYVGLPIFLRGLFIWVMAVGLLGALIYGGGLAAPKAYGHKEFVGPPCIYRRFKKKHPAVKKKRVY